MKDLPNWKRSLGKFPKLKDRKRPVSEMPKTFSGGGTAYASRDGVPPIPDTTPPGTITDLVVQFPPEDIRASRIEFTRPGDDGFVGEDVLEFQIRYSTEGAIETELDWSSATLWPWPTFVEWVEDNQGAGLPRSIELLGISSLPGVDTWAAIRYRDEAGNVGGISTGPGPQNVIVT